MRSFLIGGMMDFGRKMQGALRPISLKSNLLSFGVISSTIVADSDIGRVSVLGPEVNQFLFFRVVA